jgi:hypothetical protein
VSTDDGAPSDDRAGYSPKIARLTSLTVPRRFNGPPSSGQGGYSCAVLAARVDGPAAVSLRRPVPLDEALAIRAEDDGSVRAFLGDEVVIEALPAAPLAPWDGPVVSLAEARAAAARFSPPEGGDFDHCFVCGEARRADGFEVFPGPMPDDDLVASPWTPPAWAADEDGVVLPEFVWSALDCPGYFALHRGERLAYLARQQSEILTPIRAGETYVAIGHALERSGRKGIAATAVMDEDGRVLAHAAMVVVAPREA